MKRSSIWTALSTIWLKSNQAFLDLDGAGCIDPLGRVDFRKGGWESFTNQAFVDLDGGVNSLAQFQITLNQFTQMETAGDYKSPELGFKSSCHRRRLTLVQRLSA